MDWIKGFSKDKVRSEVVGYGNTALQLYYKKFAIDSVISLIANALVMSEFQTLENGKEVKKNNYYLLNVEPNKNQNATEFWHEVVSKLIYDNELTPRNAPSTIAKKGVDHPLFDTGQLARSIQCRVIKK